MFKFTLPFGLAFTLFLSLILTSTSNSLETQNLDLVGSWPFGISPHGFAFESITVKDNYCFLNSGRGIVALDVKDSSSPTKIAEMTIGGSLQCIGNFLYIATDKGLQIIDVSLPSAPQKVGFYTISGQYNVFVKDNYAYYDFGKLKRHKL